ncbi:hypothetical protein NEILACOT_05099 [Neisseria lactamica ATCC 23970]|uniref:Uncharacterized protein n=1 Tax=Neisseria lactamica ATCC 23970 TaxID=546265 RepID=D0WC20_NEILA|nr:hypothetical protein NEILACOT_05099 [Neisseria lactamica ATCC 23970]
MKKPGTVTKNIKRSNNNCCSRCTGAADNWRHLTSPDGMLPLPF